MYSLHSQDVHGENTDGRLCCTGTVQVADGPLWCPGGVQVMHGYFAVSYYIYYTRIKVLYGYYTGCGTRIDDYIPQVLKYFTGIIQVAEQG